MALREVHWEITNKCNLSCKHCLPMSGPARSNELTTEKAMTALEMFQAAGVSRVCFTGGEPFSRNDFSSILEMTVALGMRAAVITNATLLQESTLETIKKLGIEMGISLDGADDATNDGIRGQGIFKQVVEALKQCQSASIPTTLYVAVTMANVSQLDALAKLAREYGCRCVHFNEITISGRAHSFSDELALPENQRRCLPEIVARVASDIFGEQVSAIDERCWVDSATLYMTADGNLYVCSEIFHRRPDLAIGNICSFPLKTWMESEVPADTHHEKKCCYGVLKSEHIVFVSNIESECIFAPQKQSIETLAQLYVTLDDLYREIEQDCLDCKDCNGYPDCMGYIWLLKEEAERLYEGGVPLVQVNNGPTFIHSFPALSQGQPDLSVRYPPCSQLCSDRRRCSIHQDRPLVCRLYPLGLETKVDGTIVWALHRDCLYVRRMKERGSLSDFEYKARSIINNLSPQLLEEVVEAYRAVDAISSFPDGENNYSTLQEARYVQVQGSSRQ